MRVLLLIAVILVAGCGQSVNLRPDPQEPILTASTCAPAPSVASVTCYDARSIKARMDVGTPSNHEIECVWTCAKYNGEYGEWTFIFRPAVDGCYELATTTRADCPS